MTVTNLYGDVIIYDGTKFARSVQRCKRCGKTKYCSSIDPQCPIIDYHIYRANGKLKWL